MKPSFTPALLSETLLFVIVCLFFVGVFVSFCFQALSLGTVHWDYVTYFLFLQRSLHQELP